jgi:hypothetical protein
MKEFIKDCVLFQNKDKEMRIIGALFWLSIIGMFSLLYCIFF